LLRAWLKLLF